MMGRRVSWAVLLLWGGDLMAIDLPATKQEDLGPRAEIWHYASEALAKEQPFTVIRPEGEPPPQGWAVMFLLHGHGRHHLTLWEDAATREILLAQSCLLVMPNTGRGWYVDSPVDLSSCYEAALDELILVVARELPVATGRGSWGIAGWSMGGFGAMRTAARRADKFSFVGSMIGLLDFPRVEGLPEGQRYRVPEAIFGKDRDVWESLNPMRSIGALRRTEVFLVVAEQAFDRTMNENFIVAAAEAGIETEVVRLEGGHTFAVVTAALPHVMAASRRHFTSPSN